MDETVQMEDEEMVRNLPNSECKEGDLIIGRLFYNFGTKRETRKQFVNFVLRTKTGRGKSQTDVNFLRKQKVADADCNLHYNFVYPVDSWINGALMLKR